MNMLHRFCHDEDGAITVDFVALTAAIVTLGLVVGGIISGGAEGLSNDIEATMENMDPE
jgi:Flp pilus assembly pilin Flp